MEVFEVRVDSLVLDPKNSRKHGDKDIEATAASLRAFGQQSPIVLAPDSDQVVKGNGTVMAARYLQEEQDRASERMDAGMADKGDAELLAQDWSSLSAIRTDLVGDEQIAYAIADNKTGMLAPFDAGNLAEHFGRWNESGDLGTLAIGWNQSELGRLLSSKVDDPGEKMDRADALPAKWGVEVGHRYAIKGRTGLVHRLACGDCITSLADLIGDRKADLLCTDPPYNVNYTGTAMGDREKIANDDMGEDFGPWLHSVLTACTMYLGDGRSFYVWYADVESQNVFNAIANSGLQVRQCLIWKKKCSDARQERLSGLS